MSPIAPLPSSSPSPSTSSTELEAARSPHDLIDSAPRTEANASASGITWDERGGRWMSEDLMGGAGRGRDTEASSLRTAVNTPVEEKGEPIEATGKKIEDDLEPIWLEWEPNDPQNPQNWSLGRKWLTTSIICWFAFSAGYMATGFGSGQASMMEEFGCSRQLAVVGLAVFPFAFAFSPLALAPFSEAYGRYSTYVLSACFYCIFNVMTARANSITTVILGRTLAGLAASPGTTLAGGSIADMFDTNKRGLPMSVLTMITFMGTSFGPGLMGFVGQYCGWRWIIYIDVIVSGLLSLALIFLTQETRGSVLLSRRAKKLREEKNDPRIQCRSDAERASLLILIKISMTRPVYLLCTEAVVFFISVYISMAWGTMFLALEATSLVFENVYGFTLGQSGAVFFTMFIGGFLGFLANFYQERLYQRTVATRGPEARLYASCVGGLLFPIGLIIFAFAPGRTHWMGPVMGLFFTYFGIFCIYLASMNCTQEPFTKREAAQYAHPYFAPTDLADAYTIYASSAISGQSLMRNCVAGAFPLFTYQLYGRLGYQWASFLAAMLATVLSATPFVLLKYGPKIRAASLFSKELERMRAANPNQ